MAGLVFDKIKLTTLINLEMEKQVELEEKALRKKPVRKKQVEKPLRKNEKAVKAEMKKWRSMRVM